MKTSKQLTASTILHTAKAKYKVDVSLIFGNLVLDAAPGVSIAPAVVDAVKSNWDTLADHLSKQYHPGLKEWLAQHTQASLCSSCLDSKRETQALPNDHEQMMYCAIHHPRLAEGTLWR